MESLRSNDTIRVDLLLQFLELIKANLDGDLDEPLIKKKKLKWKIFDSSATRNNSGE